MVLGTGHGEERQNLKLFLVKIFHLHRSGPLEAFFVNKTLPTVLKTRLGVSPVSEREPSTCEAV